MQSIGIATLCSLYIPLVLLTIENAARENHVIQIGGVFETESWGQELAFKHATDKINRRQDMLPGITLSAEVHQVSTGDSFGLMKKTCALVKTGVAAIMGPMSSSSARHVTSICGNMDVPHIRATWNDHKPAEPFTINVFPHHSAMSTALQDLLAYFDWTSFTLLYEDNSGLLSMQNFLNTRLSKKHRVTLRRLEAADGDFRPVLKELKARLENRIIIDCRRENVRRLLEQADSLSMLTYMYHFIFTTLDLALVDYSGFRHEGANITGYRLVNPDSPIVRSVVQEWQREESRGALSPMLGAKQVQMNKSPSAMSITTDTALIYDAVHLFAYAVHDMSKAQVVNPERLVCGAGRRWAQGTSLMNQIKSAQIEGLTGKLEFDADGQRSRIALDVIEILSTGGIKKIGIWNSDVHLNISKAYFQKKETIYETLRNKTLKITTIQDKPFIFYAEYDKFGNKLEGNDRFSGYCIDLINLIEERIEKFQWGTLNFELQLVRDGQYGIPQDSNNPTESTWNGMVGELMRNEADLALASLTISYIREKVIDFTKPFMNLGISILYRRPDKKDPELFSFLSPLSLYVWLYMVVAYLLVSFMLFFLARFTPYEWHNPNPCHPESDLVENQFTIMNSLWFTIGSLMQQGSEVAPRAVCTRIVSGTWWFFTLIMISSYTANLAAFLTVERMISPIQSAEDLSRQQEIKYGTVISGSTFTFFKTSKIETYERMWNAMSNENNVRTVFVNSTEDGVARVLDKKEPYAYLLESTMNEYFTQRNCELMQVGGLLDSKGYGIGTPRNSPYTELLSNAILKLQEEQQLQVLYNKWWKEYGGAGKCIHTETKKKDANELSVENVGGIFVVLIVGIFLGIIIAIGEFVYKRRKDKARERGENIHSIDGRIAIHPRGKEPTLCSEMWQQFAFALKCTGPSKKKIRKRQRRNTPCDFDLRPDNGVGLHPHRASLLGPTNNSIPGKELYA